MKRLFGIAVLVVSLMFVVSCSKKGSSTSGPIHITTDGKPVMIVFYLQDCPYCHRLINELKYNPEVKKLADKMKIYYIDAEAKNIYIIPHRGKTLKVDTRTLEYVFGFRGATPYVVITDSKFKPIISIPGYLKPDTMKKVLQFILTKAYEHTDINTYLGLK